jgi:hypothetical protein
LPATRMTASLRDFLISFKYSSARYRNAAANYRPDVGIALPATG